MNKIQNLRQSEITYRVLNDFYNCLSSSSLKRDYSIYYNNGGSEINIMTVIPKEDEKIENKIYLFEAKILDKYSDKDVEIDFRLVPRYEMPDKNFVPQNFKLYVPKDKPFDPQKHLEQAKMNERLARALEKTGEHGDWAITMCYYAALHYASCKTQLAERHDVYLIYRKFGEIAYVAYKHLYDKSRNARYNPIIAAIYRKDIKPLEIALKKLEEFKKILNIK